MRDQHLKDGKGFLLVFAINDKSTFEEVKQLREQIIRLKDTKRVPLVMIGNKCDLPAEQREVDDKVAAQWCSSNKIPYMESSAKVSLAPYLF